MIDALCEALVALLRPLVDAIPDAADLGISTSPLVNEWLAGMNVYLNVEPLVAFLSGMLAAVPPLVALRLSTWAYRLLPGKAT